MFDYFKGLPSFFKTMPPSFHFYPKAKKATKPQSMLTSSLLKMVKHELCKDGKAYFKEFFADLEAAEGNLNREERLIKKFLVENF